MDNVMQSVINQIPILIMALGQGRRIYELIPLIIMPFVIVIYHNLSNIYCYFFAMKKIPANYVTYLIGDTRMNTNCAYFANFSEDLSVFLNKFNKESITNVKITMQLFK